MYCFNSMIKDEIESLDYLIAKYEEKPHDCIRGSLGFRKRNGSLSYYVSNSSSEDGKRVHKTEVIGDEYSEAVQSIKVSRFNHEVLKRLKSNRSLLGKISGNYKDYSPAAVYRELPNAYMDLPRECFVDERYEELKEWAREEYVRNGREMPRLANVTVTGEQVRSKGEAIIYNMLVYYGIPFRYESKLELIDKDGYKVTRYPDFAILTKSGRVIYWEHLGQLEKDSYMKGFIEKLLLYHFNGICAGDNLVITADRIGGSINTKAIDDLIRCCILPLVK